ncbi:MAG: GNAT family N-acetyltransferase [Planctomycetota bacterium]|jgi:ribosomal protein S18 acetylase RimI-like enzyme|nr:GNAT family N-acetyltransferase [Planctomycetota bacterium]
MATVIRKLELRDLEESAATVRESFGTVAAGFGLTRENCPTNGAFTREAHLEDDHRNGDLMYGLYVGGVQAGFAELRRGDPTHFHLRKLAVRPADRHRGFGTRLLEFVCDAARELGGKKISLGIIEKNAVLKEWYIRNGFIHTGTREYSSLPFIVGLMERSL